MLGGLGFAGSIDCEPVISLTGRLDLVWVIQCQSSPERELPVQQILGEATRRPISEWA